ncbi:uncharacterized protein [Fopius arisanus]|uniref:Uncharacterized protein n=1 Tax=Fopius arisanus TaxID=64838 RepID=A0A9R1T8V3_9HYME|nr:PREDICTED: uncharacterized protein LOC105267571 [Fopius arisanus]
MFKLFVFAAILAFAAAAPGYVAPLVSAYSAPLYSGSPLAYSAYSSYNAPYYGYAASYGLPYAYAAKPAYYI